jgi:hypothetical protein
MIWFDAECYSKRNATMKCPELGTDSIRLPHRLHGDFTHRPITQSLESLMEGMKNSKAAGLDGIYNENLKA